MRVPIETLPNMAKPTRCRSPAHAAGKASSGLMIGSRESTKRSLKQLHTLLVAAVDAARSLYFSKAA